MRATVVIIVFLSICSTSYMMTDPAMLPATIHTTPGPQYAGAARGFQGIPGIVRAANGRLWAVWYGGGDGEGPENYVMAVTSGDDGRNWSDLKLVADGEGLVRTYDPTLWLDSEGRLWLIYAQSYSWWDGRGGVWAIVAENPGDENPRWSKPRRIGDGIMMNKPTVLASGEWLFPIAGWGHKPVNDPTSDRFIPDKYLQWDESKTGAHVYLSRDKGETFELLGTAHVPEVRFEEHMIIEREDRSLWMLVRTQYGIGESISTDRGKTWSPGQPSSIPHLAARFFIRRLDSGRLLLVKHNPDMDTAWLEAGEVEGSWKQRSRLTAYLSDDDGQTWHGGLIIDERLAVSYPDGVQAPDGKIYLIYDYNRYKDKAIHLCVFTEEDVAQGAFVSPTARQRIIVNQAGAK